ncbi:MAG: NAD(P)/FAD-dependent oxidoreductase [Acidimicrobiia bacterium]
MPDCDLLVLGGGPGGHAAALEAAARGARVVLVEPADLGGQCVHHTCIPTQALLSAAVPYATAQELAIAGVLDLGDAWALGRAVARKDALVGVLGQGVGRSLRAAGVDVVEGTGSLQGTDRVDVRASDGASTELSAGAIVLATGARWEAAPLEGIPAATVQTLDALTSLTVVPKSAVIVGGGPARTAFALEYAFLLSVAGCAVTLVPDDATVVAGLDPDLDPLVRDAFSAVGITVAAPGDLSSAEGAEIVAGPDTRRPHTEGLGLDGTGIRLDPVTGGVVVDASARTTLASVYAVGDVTGSGMLSSSAAHAGRVAAANATGDRQRLRLGVLPHVLHAEPAIAWVGMSEVAARADGHDVAVGIVDLGQTARGIVLGNRGGAVKIVADRELGQVLGVHAVGPDAAEMIGVGTTALAAELTAHDLAAATHWHPGGTEALGDAARQCVGQMR